MKILSLYWRKVWKEFHLANKDKFNWCLGTLGILLVPIAFIFFILALCYAVYFQFIEKLPIFELFVTLFFTLLWIAFIVSSIIVFFLILLLVFNSFSILVGSVKKPHLCFFVLLYMLGIPILAFSNISRFNLALKITLLPAILGLSSLCIEVWSRKQEYWTEKRRRDLADVIYKLEDHIVLFGHGDLGHLVCHDIFQLLLDQNNNPFKVYPRRYDTKASCWEKVCYNLLVVEKDKKAVPFIVGEVQGLGEIGYVEISIFHSRKTKEGTVQFKQSPLASNFNEECFDKTKYLIPVLVADESARDTWEKINVDRANLVISVTNARQAENDLLEWIVERTKITTDGMGEIENRPAIIVGCETRRWREFLESRWATEFSCFEAFHVFESPAEVMSALARLKHNVAEREEPKILIVGQYHRMSLIYYFINSLIMGRKKIAAEIQNNILLLGETIDLHRKASVYEGTKNAFKKIDFRAHKGWCQFNFRVRHNEAKDGYVGKTFDVPALKEPVMRYLPIVLKDWQPHLIVIMDREPGEIIQHLTQLEVYMQQNPEKSTKTPDLVIVSPTPILRREATKLVAHYFDETYGFVTPYAFSAREMATMARYMLRVGGH